MSLPLSVEFEALPLFESDLIELEREWKPGSRVDRIVRRLVAEIRRLRATQSRHDPNPVLTDHQLLLLKQGMCPDCGGATWLAGPEGGCAQNWMCANPRCGSRFNLWLRWFAERIPEPSPLKSTAAEACQGPVASANRAAEPSMASAPAVADCVAECESTPKERLHD